MLVTHEEILEHAEAGGRVLDADVRYEERQARWHRRLISALGPYVDDSTSLGEAVERAASPGPGGLRKTQLAVELVHRYGRFFAGGVFWLSFASADEVPLEVRPPLVTSSIACRLSNGCGG